MGRFCLFLMLFCASTAADSTVMINCPLPSEWKYELTLTPVGSEAAMTTDGGALLVDKDIFVSCQIETWTFMNKFRKITEHPSLMKDETSNSKDWEKHYVVDKEYVMSLGDYIDSQEIDKGDDRPVNSLIVMCRDGVFNPDIFTNYKNWCAEGCPKLPMKWLVDNFKDVIYPKGSLSLDDYKAPVQRLPTTEIQLPCHRGFSVTNKTMKMPSGTVCGTNGYFPVVADGVETFQICSPGCENPMKAIANSIFEGESATSGNAKGDLWGEDQQVTMACKPGFQIYGSGYRKCIKTEESWKDWYGQESYKGKKGLYWDPTPEITYCFPLGEIENETLTDSARASHVTMPLLLLVTMVMGVTSAMMFV